MNLVKVFCPGCGQKLGIETDDLRQTVQCPRCQSTYDARDLVSPSMTIMPARRPQTAPVLVHQPPPPVPHMVSPPPVPAAPTVPLDNQRGDSSPHDTAKMRVPAHFVVPPPPPSPAPPIVHPPPIPPMHVVHPPPTPHDASDAQAAGEDPLLDENELEIATDSGAHRGVVRAVAFGRSGAVAASATLSRILDLADRIDSRLYGRRGWAIMSVALGAVLVGPLIDDEIHDSIFRPTMTVLFGVFLAVLGIARVASFRDENGRWSWSLARRRIGTALGEGWTFAQDFRGAPRARKLVEGGQLAAGVGLFALALRQLLFLMFAGRHGYPRGSVLLSIDTVLWCGWIAFVGGPLAWWRGRQELKGAGRSGDLIVEGEAVVAIEKAARNLPIVVDLGDTLSQSAARAAHPLLADFLDALAEWHPRRFAYEDQYQASLHRHLLRAMPDAEPERERPIKSHDGQRGRIDILLGRCLLVEMKRRLDTASAQRALGQLQMYGDMWKDRGPIVLVLCEGDEKLHDSFLGRGLEQMRARGVPIVAVLAGGRGPRRIAARS